MLDQNRLQNCHSDAKSPKTLEFCLNTCINLVNAPRYAIVVNDNSTNDERERLVRAMLSP